MGDDLRRLVPLLGENGPALLALWKAEVAWLAATGWLRLAVQQDKGT